MLTIQDISPAYQLDKWQLFLGNSLELLKKIPENSVDMVFADPPYNLSNGGFTCQSGKRVSVDKGSWDQSKGPEEDFAFHRQWIKACYRILKPEGTLWVSGSYHSIYACGYAIQLEGFKILNDISWFKPNASPNLSCRYFTASHETLIWARKDPNARHTFNYQEMKMGDWHEADKIKRDGKQMRSVWSLPTPRKKEKTQGKHPTQKPLSLLKRIVLASTNLGDIVVDPFAGSSTTGLAAYQYERQFIGIERDPEYLDISIRRIQELQGKIMEEAKEKIHSLSKQATLFPTQKRKKKENKI